MEGNFFQENKTGFSLKCSDVLELAAADDLSGFISVVESRNMDLDEFSVWYGRRNGFSKMGFQQRTPLMIASLYGSLQVMNYIVNSKNINVNRTSDSDGATALHCAAAGGSPTSVQTVKLLLDASADVNSIDAAGNKPGDLIPRDIKSSTRKSLEILLMGFTTEPALAKMEYPIDVSLPDINNGVYGSDDFRMYMFKVKPCSRAYTHDWTECPFAHPGENARRRDPSKYEYTCVPCPEFRKGSCVKGDACEYAHGVFESWLHPAQYRTRICKDETGCTRKVCFFAHKVEELRPLYASTGSAMPEPMHNSIPPTSPARNLWQNKVNRLSPPALQPPWSRLKMALNARDFEQQKIDDLFGSVYSNSNRFEELKPKNLDDVFGSFDSSPKKYQQGFNQFHLSKPMSFGFDSSGAVAQGVMNSRSGAFARQRSQSFIDRGSVGSMSQSHGSGRLTEWGTPDGKLEWGFKGQEANKLRKSASFRIGSGNGAAVNTLVKDVSSEKHRYGGSSGEEKLPEWVEQMCYFISKT